MAVNARDITSYEDLVAALAARRRALGITQREADARAGLPDGYTGKIECGDRRLGPLSLGLLLQTLRCRLLAPDYAAALASPEEGTHGQAA